MLPLHTSAARTDNRARTVGGNELQPASSLACRSARDYAKRITLSSIRTTASNVPPRAFAYRLSVSTFKDPTSPLSTSETRAWLTPMRAATCPCVRRPFFRASRSSYACDSTSPSRSGSLGLVYTPQRFGTKQAITPAQSRACRAQVGCRAAHDKGAMRGHLHISSPRQSHPSTRADTQPTGPTAIAPVGPWRPREALGARLGIQRFKAGASMPDATQRLAFGSPPPPELAAADVTPASSCARRSAHSFLHNGEKDGRRACARSSSPKSSWSRSCTGWAKQSLPTPPREATVARPMPARRCSTAFRYTLS